MKIALQIIVFAMQPLLWWWFNILLTPFDHSTKSPSGLDIACIFGCIMSCVCLIFAFSDVKK
jgi:hypothetical protein